MKKSTPDLNPLKEKLAKAIEHSATDRFLLGSVKWAEDAFGYVGAHIHDLPAIHCFFVVLPSTPHRFSVILACESGRVGTSMSPSMLREFEARVEVYLDMRGIPY